MKIHLLSRGLWRWLRDLHCYIGLLISPFILLFAITAIMFNHSWKTGAVSDVKIEKTSTSVDVPKDVEGLAQAKQIMRQVDVSGEVIATRYMPKQNSLTIAATKPGQFIRINVDLETQKAEIERRRTGFWKALIYLHKSPGPHDIKTRADWFYMKLWSFLADATVYLFVFILISGVCIWYIIKSERRIGFVILAAGCLSFLLIVLAIVD